jgi:UDP-4-amino-4,6-dideoxy-N-acetyl-beta-L-altrosamine transaminase
MTAHSHIPYGRHTVTEADIQAVVDVLRSDFLTQGPVVPAFEQAVATYCKAEHGIAVNSATSALHIACLALGLGHGDWLWTSPITFVASANCGLYCGAQVDFVDIDPRTFNLCPTELEKKLVLAKQQGKLPKVVVAVHLCGQPCDMAAIHALSLQYGFKVIEDASHAIGATYKGEAVGNCRYSDITVFSFHPVKIITTAEGGMAVTNDPHLAQQMGLFRSHGITRDPEHMNRTADGPWYYQQIALGFNYRMTELQAALGLSQMNLLDHAIARRHALADQYSTLLQDLGLDLPWQHPDSHSSYHLYVVQLQDTQLHSHRAVFESLRAQHIGVNLHYIPVHTQPFYAQMGFKANDFPKAQSYYSKSISIPMYASLSDAQQQHVADALAKAVAP